MDKLNQNLLSDSFEGDSTVSFISHLESGSKSTRSSKELLSEAAMVSSELLLEQMPNIISLSFLGAYSSVDAQSSYGLVLVWTICFGYCIYEGLAAGMESLLSPLKKEITIILYHRTLILCILMIIPIFIFLMISKSFIFPLLLDEDANAFAGNMVLYTIISIFFNSGFLVSRSLMNARQSFNHQLVSTIISSFFHVVICIFLFKFCGFTNYGAVIAKILTDIFNLNLFMYLTNLRSELKLEHFQSVTKDQISELAKTLLPRGVVLSLEILAYETFTFQTVSMANEEISTHIIGTNMHNIGYFIFTGVSVVTYLKVAKYIVQYRRRSIEYMKTGAIILLVLVVFFLFGMFLLPWRQLFTSDETVMHHLYTLTPFLVMYTCLDCLQVFLSAISRALGKHHEAFVHFLVSYFLIGEPLCFVLKAVFPEYGVRNVWISMVVGVLLYDIWQTRTLLAVDLEVAAKVIAQEVREQEEENRHFMETYYPEFVSEKSYKSCQEFEMSTIENSRYSFMSLSHY